jgi:hypothetical protein
MQCGQRAVLVITREVAGTATNVASRRLELVCSKPEGHDGRHYDPSGEEWDAEPGKTPTLLRHETAE